MDVKYHRYLLSLLNQESHKKRVRLILGARQTGKTTLFSLLKDKNDILIDLQDRSERLRFLQDPSLLTRTVLAIKTPNPNIFIDEIQKVPELLDEIQFIVDKNPGKFTFTLTGSSSRRLKSSSSNLLPGRARIYFISPILLAEQKKYLNNKHLILPLDEYPDENASLFPDKEIEDMLVFGTLPGLWGNMFKEDLESYVMLYVEEEIQKEALVRNISNFSRFLKLAAIESGKFINLSKISQETGIAVSTIKEFYKLLEDTFIGFSIFPFAKSNRIRLLKSPKFYFFDVGVRNVVAGLPLDKGILSTEGGHLFEHFIASELYWRCKYLGRNYNLYYFRSVSGLEVDFVIETPNEIIPVEIKYTNNISPNDANKIEKFINLFPSAKRGFVIANIKREEQLSKNVLAVGWHQI